MLYKLIILVASVFMIYEFTKSRSTAVASIEPTISKRIGIPEYTGEPIQIRVPFEQNYREPDMSAINAWMKLHGV